ncbi:hypothetical protein M409DRAFT_29211 [Zasmidium cellare ATCC 36951]|uniref:Cytochrome P450 n=1 Tax=Zasmidium cellare ATCC 36951 TaxID=1080233 RepID=A0A6A6C3B5_ZASCE|nr:uncharacterized protein M409DRAFT_29211 [Zasmidium cellare ATCC 36951]KAF2160362.1 hypothetical protein M409DRAFT_29211 [Zasmidium cellare ATCC 36951]
MFSNISLTLQLLPILALTTLLTRLTWSYLRLRHIPGPFIASLTDLWRLIDVWRRDAHNTHIHLHAKYGDVVRIGPNTVLVSRPDIVQDVYGISKGFVKSEFYHVWQNIVNGKRAASLVFTTDEAEHAKMKRPIASAYSLSTLVEFEPLIDSTTAVFLSRLDEVFANTGKVCDLGTWLQWYAFDVIGELTLSQRLGFLEQAKDVRGIIASVAANFDRCSVLGQMPWLDLWTYKNPLYLHFLAKPVSNPILLFGQKLLQDRLNDLEPPPSTLQVQDPTLCTKILHGTLPSKPDFLSRFLHLHAEQPDIVTDRALLTYLFMNINAGSDTIASTLRAILYYLLKTPTSLSTLHHELSTAARKGHLTLPLPSWTESRTLPYLNAVITESLRLNPALGLPLERIVPATGLHLGQIYIPPGTVVGVNPWAHHRNAEIFGPDAADWRPERWIEASPEQVKYMEGNLLTFGAGKRTCLGRNIAMLELTKLVPALVMRYEMELEDPRREWRVVNSFAVRQEGLDVLIKKR